MNNLEIVSRLLFLIILSNFIKSILVEILESDHCIERIISGIFPQHPKPLSVPVSESLQINNSSSENSVLAQIKNDWLRRRTKVFDKWRLA